MIWISVDLPAPYGPKRPYSPGPSVSDTPESAFFTAGVPDLRRQDKAGVV